MPFKLEKWFKQEQHQRSLSRKNTIRNQYCAEFSNFQAYIKEPEVEDD